MVRRTCDDFKICEQAFEEILRPRYRKFIRERTEDEDIA